MSQVVGFPGSGLRLSNAVAILAGVGDPNASQTHDVIHAGVASLFLRQDSGQLYICSQAVVLGTAGVLVSAAIWTQLS